jgi:hypothetical protein
MNFAIKLLGNNGTEAKKRSIIGTIKEFPEMVEWT